SIEHAYYCSTIKYDTNFNRIIFLKRFCHKKLSNVNNRPKYNEKNPLLYVKRVPVSPNKIGDARKCNEWKIKYDYHGMFRSLNPGNGSVRTGGEKSGNNAQQKIKS